ncbi:MAG: NAD-dependent malic enzyme [Firmicutes bacterium HGW-Firmicutes-14]|nr:MAG: NAD-dependent malic enzyme [Firmicutes bacterium HGW-Firmicutes-14]
MSIRDEALMLHLKNKGKIEVRSKVQVLNEHDLSLAYTPGVAEPCREIALDRDMVYKYTSKGNMVAVVSDGTAVLGLGDIGPEAALPVMEGKAVLFKEFAGVDAFPICVGTKDPDEIVRLIKLLEPSFGGINLEDIAAPRCFEIEQRLKAEMDIPVFHDDQHGTAIVVLAGLLNALKLAEKKINTVTAVVNGSGSAGIAITKLLIDAGIGNVVMCDLQGIIHRDADWLNQAQREMSRVTNKENLRGRLEEALVGADVFIGVSAPGVLKKEHISVMSTKSILFAMANPIPEIMPEEARDAGVFVIATGRSDYPNQINNVLAFPGIFRGALDVRARNITEGMKMAAAEAIAGLVPDDEIDTEYIIPKPFDRRVVRAVAKGVAKAAIKEGVARINTVPEYKPE